jgi:hypothetical protein
MHLVKKIRLLGTFYSSFCIPSFIITLIGLYFFWQHDYSIYSTVFWFKLITMGVIYYYINSYKSKEYFYYQNLGLSKTFLWVSLLLFDFLLFLFLISQLGRFK